MDLIDSLEPRRLFTAGAPDTTFGGGDGSVDVRTNVHDWAVTARDAAEDDAGRTLIASFYRAHRQVTLTRLTADGAVDATFGKDGLATIASGFNSRANGAFEISVDHAGRVLVMLKNRLTRFGADGSVDKTFGTKGTIAALPVLSGVADLTVDASNRPLIVGTAQGKTGTRGTIVRLTTAGALDASFGTGGAFKTPVPGGGTQSGGAVGIALKVVDDGDIIGVATVGYRAGEDDRISGISAFRLSGNGVLHTKSYGNFDPIYGTAGSIDLLGDSNDIMTTHDSFEGFYSDGGFLFSVQTEYDNNPDRQTRVVSHIDASGSGVGNAQNEGLVPAELASAVDSVNASVLGIQDDAKLLVSGYSTVASGYIEYRLLSNFTLDPTFAPVPPFGGFLEGDRVLTFAPAREGDVVLRSTLHVTAIAL